MQKSSAAVRYAHLKEFFGRKEAGRESADDTGPMLNPHKCLVRITGPGQERQQILWDYLQQFRGKNPAPASAWHWKVRLERSGLIFEGRRQRWGCTWIREVELKLGQRKRLAGLRIELLPVPPAAPPVENRSLRKPFVRQLWPGVILASVLLLLCLARFWPTQKRGKPSLPGTRVTAALPVVPPYQGKTAVVPVPQKLSGISPPPKNDPAAGWSLLFRDGRRRYLQGDWPGARAVFQELLSAEEQLPRPLQVALRRHWTVLLKLPEQSGEAEPTEPWSGRFREIYVLAPLNPDLAREKCRTLPPAEGIPAALKELCARL